MEATYLRYLGTVPKEGKRSFPIPQMADGRWQMADGRWKKKKSCLASPAFWSSPLNWDSSVVVEEQETTSKDLDPSRRPLLIRGR